MTEEQPEEDSGNIYYKQLRDSENKLDVEIKSMSEMPEAQMSEYRSIIEHLSSVLMDVLTGLRSQPEPDKVFAAALRGLDKLQREQFLLENILESLKRGETLPTIQDRFAGLGLFHGPKPSSGSAQVVEPDQPVKEQGTGIAKGSFFLRLRRKLGKSSTLLAKVALKAAQAAGKFVEIVPVIGFIGPIPTVNLQLQPKGATIDELLELVMDILDES